MELYTTVFYLSIIISLISEEMQMDLWPPRSFSSVKWDTPPDMCLGVPQSCRFQRKLVVPAGEEGRGGAGENSQPGATSSTPTASGLLGPPSGLGPPRA